METEQMEESQSKGVKGNEKSSNPFKLEGCSGSYLVRCLSAIKQVKSEFFRHNDESRFPKTSKNNKNADGIEKYFNKLYRNALNKIDHFKKIKK